VVIALIDLHLDPLVDRIVLALGRLGDADEDAGVGALAIHLVDHANRRVADLLSREPDVVLGRVRVRDQHAVFDLEAGGMIGLAFVPREARPAVQVLAVEERRGLGSTAEYGREREARDEGHTHKSSLLLPHCEIPLHERVDDALHTPAWPGPRDLNPVDLRRAAGAQNLARIVRGEIAPAIVLEAGINHTPPRPPRPPPAHAPNSL